ncbi:DNA polymerase V [Pseudomonas sp. BIGb0278]|uniref:LexA family protein n=1 Tax=Pseudomonas sp. BIGb0278 TaxID=2940607 RepID=UPI002166E4D8|nr:S24 family peptidase [Pseudomonas sp. BIGb0278]MCS4284397.1 DNA polymerase V [Pseudomonas sp. BIGb0278]
MTAANPFEYVEDLQAISLDELMQVHAPNVYLVRIDGDSMQGAGIFDEDVAIVDKAIDARAGHIVIAAVNGEPVCKRLDYVGRQIVLRSENPRYAPRFIMEGDEFSVWGVVTYSLRSHGPMSCTS